jgi:REP element-mobilizing transposase RayT
MEKETFTWLQPGAWRKPCIVHVTMTAKERQPIFGALSHNGSIAYVEKSSLGWILVNQQKKMLTLCPEIKILADKVMPDHHHMVLQVMRDMRRSIKEVVRGYMQGCKAEARKLGFKGNIYDDVPYYRVLTHKGQLRSMINYVYANAERAWQRKQNPFLFRMHRHTDICGLTFTSLGNHFLLDWADRQMIEIPRNASDEYIEQQLQHSLMAAQNGAITYTAAISKGEQTIARNLREHRFPLVILLNNGFPKEGSPHEKYYKPGGVYFEACAKGQLLLLEPTEQTFDTPSVATATIATLQRKEEEKHLLHSPIPASSQRYRFIALNEIVRLLCNQTPD